MAQQVIYSRFEYPIGNKPASVIFAEYRGKAIRDERGVSVAGYDVVVSGEEGSATRTAIVLTYDIESDIWVRLMLASKPELKYLEVTPNMWHKLQTEEQL